jgi:hypothetical protein
MLFGPPPGPTDHRQHRPSIPQPRSGGKPFRPAGCFDSAAGLATARRATI